jgi:hypothetical protein
MRNPKVTTNRTVDTSSLDAIVAAVVRPSMTNEEKALALLRWWRGAVYHYGYPYMLRRTVESWQDPIKMVNVHGYGLCGTHGRVFGRLATRVFGEGNARLVGFGEAEPGIWRLDECAGAFQDSASLRGFSPASRMGHSTCELFYDGRWRLLDPHVQFYAYLRDGQGIAGGEDLIADPTLVTKPVKRIPSLMPCGDLSRVFYASTFMNWGELVRDDAPDDHTLDITLRRGETYTRYWDRKGPFLWFDEMDRRWDPVYLNQGPRHLCEGEECWQHYGNGDLVYRPRLTDASYRDGVTAERGLAEPTRRGLSPIRAGRLGQVTFAVVAPYMLAAAKLKLDFTRLTGSDTLRVWVRPAGGNWRLVWDEPHCGRRKRELDLSPWVAKRYAYEVRFDLRGGREPEHAALHALTFETTFVLNYLVLPRLLPGRNRITVQVADPAELHAQTLDITYAWQDREGEHVDTRTVTDSPYGYDLTVAPVLTTPAANPKYMRYLRMGVR